ncbi:MAG: sulfatase [Chloroflexota bacterium]
MKPRHQFVVLLTLVVSLAHGLTRPPAVRSVAEPYNFVVVYTDDQRWDTVCTAAAGLTEICQLPANEHPMAYLEELMLTGVTFTNAFASNPVCCPARASLLSGGFLAQHTNVLTNDWPNGGALRFSDSQTLATLLQQNGYQTAMIGKYLNEFDELLAANPAGAYVPPGWSSFIASHKLLDWNTSFRFLIGSSTWENPGVGVIRSFDSGIYLTDFMKVKALEFLDETCPDETCTSPFFLFLSTNAPHEPATPADRHATLYSDFVYDERGWAEQPDGDVTDKPVYVQELAADWDPVAREEFHRDQLRSLRAVDEALQAIVHNLEEKNLLSSTVIIFASDNGYLWGEHKVDGKFKPYEESIRVPLVVVMPGVEPRTDDNLVAVDLDIAPTIMELAQIDPVGSDGVSLVSLMQDPNTAWREELLIQHFAGRIPSWAGLRTADNWKYLEYATGEKELYDLAADPYELTSLHADPNYANVMADFASRLAQQDRGLTIRTDSLPDPQSDRLPKAHVGALYTFQFTAWGGHGEHQWSHFVDTGSCRQELPAGFSLSSSGLLSGASLQSGSWRFCVQVEDSSTSPQPGNGRPQMHIQSFRLRVTDR